MDTGHSELSDPGTTSITSPEERERIPTAREVLQQFFQLLEEYAPVWYTEELHNRAVAALGEVNQATSAISKEKAGDR